MQLGPVSIVTRVQWTARDMEAMCGTNCTLCPLEFLNIYKKAEYICLALYTSLDEMKTPSPRPTADQRPRYRQKDL